MCAMKDIALAELASFIFNPLGWKNRCEHLPELAHHYETMDMPEWVSETITSDITPCGFIGFGRQ